MGTNLLASLYLTLGLLIAAVEAHRMWARRSFDSLSLFNGAYFLLFVFVPLNVIVLGEGAVRQKYVYKTWSHGDIWTASVLILSYVAFTIGYFRHSNATPVIEAGLWRHVHHAAHWLIGSFFVIGGFALMYHISLVGGVIEALQVAPRVRTGEFRLEGKVLFVRQFSYFLATAFMLNWAIHIDASQAERRSKGLRWFLLILLGLSFVYYALSTYGRREFLYPMIICLMLWVLVGQRRQWGDLALHLALCVLWFTLYSILIPAATQPAAQTATAQTATAQTAASFLWGVYISTTQGLGDSFMHFVAAQHAVVWQFGFLTDIWELPLQFLPSQVLGFERPRGMFGETSEFILGRPLEPGLAGEEPLGLHGYLLVNFSYFGMLIVFYLMGTGYRVLDVTLRSAKGGAALNWLVWLWAVIGALEFLREGVLILVIKPRFSWWLASGILLWFGYRRMLSASSQNS